ncbi:MAG TPA: hypothetical protein VGR92_07055 [Steroidobacteraceae bacterium]|nr:hypothetical protein [Steroidobacteraceae bacterium]
MTDEDQDWLDALAGRATSGAHGAASREAQRLREHIQRNVRAPDVAVAQRDAQREAQLLDRAQREGLIDPAQLTRRTRRRLQPGAFGGLVALAAGLAGITVALTMFLHGAPLTQHLRGARENENVIRIEAADPTALKMEILDQLRAAGVSATGYERLGVAGINADLPKPVPPRVRDVLTRHHLSVPNGGELRVEIAPPSAP